MTTNKRILNTGALAAAATIAFAIFAYRVADWSRGIDSEAVAQGQATSPCSAGTEGALETTRVIPQVAVGSFDSGLTKYQTFIQIVNPSGAPQTITGSFYEEDGSPMDNVTLIAGDAAAVKGVIATTSIAKDGALVIRAEAATAGTLGWAKITSCSAVSISSFFELRDGVTNVLLSRGSVAATPANMSNFVVPRIREATTGLDVAVALVNTSSGGPATLKAELRDFAGNTIATKNVVIAARSHQQFFMKDLFAPLTEPAGRSYQYVKFSSASPTFAAIALAIEGSTLTSVPVDVLE